MQRKSKLNHEEIEQVLGAMVEDIVATDLPTESLVVIGLANGGVVFARLLAARLGECLGCKVPLGVIDISFYRDDLSEKPITKIKYPTDLPFDLDDKWIVLADDVLESGRSVRAGLAEVFDQGRPSRVDLAVLVDRGNRRLPIAANFVGVTLEVASGQKVRVFLSDEHSEQNVIEVVE